METFAKLLCFQPTQAAIGEEASERRPSNSNACATWTWIAESRRLQTDSNVDAQWRNRCGAQDVQNADQVCTFHRRTIILVSPPRTPACSYSPLHPERDAPPRHARILRLAPSAPPGCSFTLRRSSRCTSLPFLDLISRLKCQWLSFFEARAGS